MKNLTLIIVLISSYGLTTSAQASNKLFVGGLSFATTSAEVNRLVSDFGTVLSVKVRSIDFNGDLSAKAIVKMSSSEEVATAVAVLDGFIYLGEPVKARANKHKKIIVVGSKVKDVVRSAGFRSDGELVQAVSDKVYELLKAAISRAGHNKRGTVRPYDL